MGLKFCVLMRLQFLRAICFMQLLTAIVAVTTMNGILSILQTQ